LEDQTSEPNPLAGLPRVFFSRSLPQVEVPWNMSAMPDLIYPTAGGERPADLENQLKYDGALLRLAMREATVYRLVAEVQRRLKPPSVVPDPAMDLSSPNSIQRFLRDPKRDKPN
jgi:hypothetical protein